MAVFESAADLRRWAADISTRYRTLNVGYFVVGNEGVVVVGCGIFLKLLVVGGSRMNLSKKEDLQAKRRINYEGGVECI
jgi:hypothetical protein